ncbi:hypothetical protein JCM19045_458 [Bacillus sp. JCM 19045]|nr:hypothetical protein JCM19045_458 [Bacillus sp. JCM 19045]
MLAFVLNDEVNSFLPFLVFVTVVVLFVIDTFLLKRSTFLNMNVQLLAFFTSLS